MFRGEKSKIFLNRSSMLGQTKKGQIWVETVLYTLIALALIGAVLAFIVPQLGKIQDRTIAEQSVEMLQSMNSRIVEVASSAAGNKRIVDVKISAGKLKIDGENNQIIFELITDSTYTEIGENVNFGNVVVLTEKEGSTNKITMTLSYSEYNLTNKKLDDLESLSQASTPYKISIENLGVVNGKVVVNLVVS